MLLMIVIINNNDSMKIQGCRAKCTAMENTEQSLLKLR